uniref:Tubulin--tyrosine ligase-like protein 9 n=1 Tax=Rhabditophanes sp. KR3021 TaxID=114890 RepID=A0AC35U304_9BILA
MKFKIIKSWISSCETKVYWKCALVNTIHEVLTNRPNWHSTQSESWNFYWVNREWMNTIYDKHKFKDGQLINHFKNDYELTRKDNLIKNLKKGKKIPELANGLNFVPVSYVLPVEWHLFVEEFRKYNSNTIWIMKPVAGAQGKGIFLFKKLKEIIEWKKKDPHSTEAEPLPYVVQMYISHPCLIGGKKFDIRLYVLVTSFRPLTVWVHREGFARFSHAKYDLSTYENAYVHLTNVAIAKTAGDFDPERGLKWSLHKLLRYLTAIHGDEIVTGVMNDIAWIFINSLRSVQPLIIQDKHCFELYGYDILIDSNLKAWLLEVNASPSLTPSSQDDFEMKYRVLNHMLNVLDLEKRLNGGESQIDGFDILVNNNEVVYKSSFVSSEMGNVFEPKLNIKIEDNLHHSLADEKRLENITVVPGSSKRLTEYLMNNHNMNAPPDGTIHVEYELELVHILGIDELKQTMTVLVYVDERWTDPSLAWNPADYGGIEKTWIPTQHIWSPDIIVFNLVSASRLQHENLLSNIRSTVVLFANGTVESSKPEIFCFSCTLNIRNFPLDDQLCNLEVASWAYSWDKIRLKPHVEHSLEHYTQNEEWHLLNISVHESEYEHEGMVVSEILYAITVRRKPLFYMVTLTFPSYVMCAISVVGLFARFSTTGEREERFTLGVTAILTMAVLSLVVSEKVPHSSTSVPLLVTYFLFNMVTVSLAAMSTGFVMKVHRLGRSGKEPPAWLLKVFFLKVATKIPLITKSKRNSYKKKTILVTEDCVHSNNVMLKNSDQDDTKNLICNIKNGLNFFPEQCYGYPKSNFPLDDEFLSKKISSLEQTVFRLNDLYNDLQSEFGDFEWQEQNLKNNKISKEYNGYVRISERLDWFLMCFFLFLVTVPVIILFSLM